MSAAKDAHDAESDLGQRSDQAARILYVALEELLDALAHLLGRDAKRVGHFAFQVVDGARDRIDELLRLVDERRDDQRDDPREYAQAQDQCEEGAEEPRDARSARGCRPPAASGIAMMIVIRIATTRVRSWRKSSPSTSSAAASSTAR